MTDQAVPLPPENRAARRARGRKATTSPPSVGKVRGGRFTSVPPNPRQYANRRRG